MTIKDLNTAEEHNETLFETVDRWQKEWEKKHSILHWIDERCDNKSIANLRASYALTHPWEILEEWGRQIKWAWQRAFRGWDDTVIWSIDYHLAEMLPVWLRKLKEIKQGIPMCMYKKEDLQDPNGNISQEAMGRAEKKYDAILEKIAKGFKSYSKKDNCGFQSEEEKEYRKKFEEAFRLFKKYFETFWD